MSSFPLAFPHVNEPVYFLNEATLQEGMVKSQTSPRRRIALPIHRHLSDQVQRMVNFLQPGTYIAPHHHPADAFCETILVLRGQILFLEFNSNGEIARRRLLTEGTPDCLVDLVGPVIHAFVCLRENTAVLEIKKGPYGGINDKVFAPWAPLEGSVLANEYLAKMEMEMDLVRFALKIGCEQSVEKLP